MTELKILDGEVDNSWILLKERLSVLRESFDVHDEVLWQAGDDISSPIPIHHLLKGLAIELCKASKKRHLGYDVAL
eukprot:scaffold243150_cov31-Tisochrysis_lutea.AAC.1